MISEPNMDPDIAKINTIIYHVDADNITTNVLQLHLNQYPM